MVCDLVVKPLDLWHFHQIWTDADRMDVTVHASHQCILSIEKFGKILSPIKPWISQQQQSLTEENFEQA